MLMNMQMDMGAGQSVLEPTIVIDIPEDEGAFTFAGAVYTTEGEAVEIVLSAPALGTDLVWTKESGDLPDGLSFTDNEDGTAKIHGTPASAASPVAIAVRATKTGGRKVDKTIQLGVAAPAPAITTTEVAAMTPGEAYDSGALSVSGGAAPLVFSLVSTDIPGLLVDPDDGSMTVAEAPEEGTYSATVRVTDAFGRTDDQAYVVESGAATWAEIWAGAAHIYDLDESRVTLATTKVALVANAGGAAACWAQADDGLRPTYVAEHAGFNGLPAMDATGGNRAMILRNDIDTADLTLESFFVAAVPNGWVSMLVELTNVSGIGTPYYSLPGLFGDASAAAVGINDAGSDAKTAIGFWTTGDGRELTQTALARSTPVLLSVVKSATHAELWFNTTKVADLANTEALSSVGNLLYWMRNYNANTAVGYYGPMAGSTGAVPGDFAARLAAACALAGIA